MSKLIICRGSPGVGKSTYTKQMVAERSPDIVRVCKDEMRLMLHQTHRFGLEYMEFYNHLITQLWTQSIIRGFDVVLDETFVRVVDCRRVVDDYARMLRSKHSYDNIKNWGVEVLDFTKIPFEEIVRRDAGRHPSLGFAVLDEYRRDLEREGETCSIMASLQEAFGLSIKVTTISSPLLNDSASA